MRGRILEREFELYLREHRNRRNRVCHLVGIPVLVLTGLLGLMLWNWRLFWGGQAVGWMFQLVGHRLEGNRPAFLKRPISTVMGPLMVSVELLGLLGVRFAFAERARQSAYSGGHR